MNEGPNQCVLLQGGREDLTFRQKEVGPLPHAGKCLMADWGTCLSRRGESVGVPEAVKMRVLSVGRGPWGGGGFSP